MHDRSPQTSAGTQHDKDVTNPVPQRTRLRLREEQPLGQGHSLTPPVSAPTVPDGLVQ